MYSTLSRCLRLTPSGRWTTYWQRRISATYRTVFTRRSTRIPSRISGSGSTPIRHPWHERSLTKSKNMAESKEARNKALVLKAFDTLFNKRDYAAAERLWSPNYIQHSAHIEPGREGLINLIRSLPPTLKYEAGTIVADGNFV